jgi:hypothetical protein
VLACGGMSTAVRKKPEAGRRVGDDGEHEDTLSL